MKKIIGLHLLVFLFSLKTEAQTSLIATFQTTHAGRSLTVIGTKSFNKKNELGIGLRYNINQKKLADDQGNIFKKRLYAREPIQFFGIELYYNRYLKNNWKFADPFIFCDAQVTYSETYNRAFLPIPPRYYPQKFEGFLFDESKAFFGPFTWTEQCLGFGLKVKVTDQFFLTHKIGFGTCFILGKEIQLLGTYDKFEWEFGGIIQVGLLYEFKTKEQN